MGATLCNNHYCSWAHGWKSYLLMFVHPEFLDCAHCDLEENSLVDLNVRTSVVKLLRSKHIPKLASSIDPWNSLFSFTVIRIDASKPVSPTRVTVARDGSSRKSFLYLHPHHKYFKKVINHDYLHIADCAKMTAKTKEPPAHRKARALNIKENATQTRT